MRLSFSIQAIKNYLREMGYDQTRAAILINIIEGHGELKYQEGIRDANKPGAAEESRDALRILRGGRYELQNKQRTK